MDERFLSCRFFNGFFFSSECCTAPDGSKCDDGKMCISQKCVAIDLLRKDGKVKDCQNDCNNHGICDNIGMFEIG